MNNKTFKLLIIVCFLAIQTSLNAQKELNNRAGLTFSSLGVSDLVGEESGSASYIYDSKSFYTLGVTYIRGLNKWLEVETGVEYSSHKIGVLPNYFPGMDIYMRKPETKMVLFNIPATLRANFLKYFFINAGVLIDIDATNSNYIENQTGIGGIAGLGANYDFKSGLSIFLNPYIKAHSWIDTGTRTKILEKGFRLGLTCDLRKIMKKK
jgi:hypothetical protein